MMVCMSTGEQVRQAVVPQPSRGVIATKYPLFTRVALVSAWLVGGLVAVKALSLGITAGNLGMDAHAYWRVAQGGLMYDKAPGQMDAYLYSPAFAAAIWPLAMLPWPLFLAVWISLETAALVWLLKPLRARWSIPLFLFCIPEVVIGNVYLLLAATAVAGLRKPALWAFPILTKITPGIGLLWFAIRGEWRRFLQAAAATTLLAFASYLIMPSQWHQWIGFLLGHSKGARDGGVGFGLRCLLAVALVAFGARTNRPWLIAPAMVLSSPMAAGPTLTLLAAVPRFLGLGRDNEAGSRCSPRRSPSAFIPGQSAQALAHDGRAIPGEPDDAGPEYGGVT
jgi:Glycosyltransferase family 87